MRRFAVVFVPPIVFAACSAFSSDDAERTSPEAGAPEAGATDGDAFVPPPSDDAGDAGPSWTLYSFASMARTWGNVPLSDVWKGENAPPASSIAAITQFSRFRRMLVATTDGTLYDRGPDDVWRTPQKLMDVFSVPSVDMMSHAEGDPTNPAYDDLETLFVVTGSNEKHYDAHAAPPFSFVGTSALKNEDAGPQRGDLTPAWNFEIFDHAKFGACDWQLYFVNYGQLVWRIDGCFQTWSSAAPEDVDLWKGVAGAPDWSRVRAAYWDSAATFNAIVE